MIVYPAIDIRGGRCVRLVEGDFARETVFDADPADAARRWVAEGATWLHVVDLDGAVAGHPVNAGAIARIRAAAPATVGIQLGGGLREVDHLAAAFDLGVDRCVIGTAAIDRPELVEDAVARWGDRIAVGLDARDGRLAAGGWLQQTDVAAVDLAVRFQAAGVVHLVFTDIRRDGTLTGPNLPALRDLVDRLRAARADHPDGSAASVIASGGVGQPADIGEIAATGAAGVIIGRALFDGRVQLPDAMRLAG